ncbi:MAG: class I SAM-dependent methyltransferase [Pseudomonadota bacterium]
MDTAIAIDVAPVTPDFGAIKAKQQATWATGDYSVVGTTLQIVGEQLCETINLAPGSRVLDVAAGNGNVTLAAARRFCQVTSTDYIGALLEGAKKRAEAERLDVTFQTADAEDLPFQDESFDAVLSTFGVMFTPDQAKAASELLRVCRKGGVIGMANWTPGGFIGQVFKTIGSHIPPAPGLKPPSRWGTEQGLTELFGDKASLSITPRKFIFRYRSADHFLEVFRTYYGPINKAFEALGDQGDKLEDDLRRLLFDLNIARDGTLAVPSDYVDVTLHKR